MGDERATCGPLVSHPLSSSSLFTDLGGGPTCGAEYGACCCWGGAWLY